MYISNITCVLQCTCTRKYFHIYKQHVHVHDKVHAHVKVHEHVYVLNVCIHTKSTEQLDKMYK